MSEYNSKKMFKRWLKNTKAVSPIIATLLMIVISVVAGVMIYGWISGFISTGVPSAPQLYIVSISSATNYNGTYTSDIAAAYSYSDVKIRVSNTGLKDITSVGAVNIIIKDNAGNEYDSATTDYMVWGVSTSSGVGGNSSGVVTAAPTAQTGTVAVDAGETTTIYVRLHNTTVATAPFTGHTGLPYGASYTINLIDVAAYDGSPVISAEVPVRITK